MRDDGRGTEATTKYFYDAAGRLVTVRHPEITSGPNPWTPEERFTYTSHGLLHTHEEDVADAVFATQEYAYDCLDRIVYARRADPQGRRPCH